MRFFLRISMQVGSFVRVCVWCAIKNNILLLRVPSIDCYNIDCNKQSFNSDAVEIHFGEGG